MNWIYGLTKNTVIIIIKRSKGRHYILKALGRKEIITILLNEDLTFNLNYSNENIKRNYSSHDLVTN